MTERNLGNLSGICFFTASVVNVNDPDKCGRHQIRINGFHDDVQNIPDAQLPWAMPMQGIRSAAHNKIGQAPVGIIKGTTVIGMFLDADHQYPIIMGTMAKAGDAQQNSGTTVNGQEQLQPGTNSTPPGARLTTNKTNTQATQNIQQQDQAKDQTFPGLSFNPPNYPHEFNDSDAQDLVHNKSWSPPTKFSQIPTVGSIMSPQWSILNQSQQVDPQNQSASLKQAIPNFIKIKQLLGGMSQSGSTNMLGQMMGAAMQAISGMGGGGGGGSSGSESSSSSTSSTLTAEQILTAIANAASQGQLSDTTQTVLYQAVTALLTALEPTDLSSDPLLGPLMAEFTQALLSLLQSNNLTLQALEALIAQFLALIQQTATNQALGQGVNSSNVLNQLSSVLPQLAGAITSVLDNHLPPSVLNKQSVTQALQKFTMNMGLLKKPNTGLKDLAAAAATPTPNQQGLNIGNLLSQASISLPTNVVSQITGMFTQSSVPNSN